MPSGKIHTKIWHKLRFSSLVLGIGTLIAWKDPALSIAILPGYWFGLLVDPDWDMPAKITEAKKRWLKFPLIGAMVVVWIDMYGHFSQLFLGGHRSTLTHMPGLSTAIRLIWLLAPALLMLFAVSPELTANLLQRHLTTSIMLGIFLGLTLSDTVHTTADIWR